MRAILRQQFGGPEQLLIQHVSHSETRAGARGDRGQAFGLNHAETYMRKGDRGDVVTVSGIECMGVVKADADGKFTPGQKVAVIMGGMGRTIDGSYAEYTSVPASHVLPVSERDACRIGSQPAKTVSPRQSPIVSGWCRLLPRKSPTRVMHAPLLAVRPLKSGRRYRLMVGKSASNRLCLSGQD